MSEVIENGDRIEWVYEHHLNRKSSIYRKKSGVFIRKIKLKNVYAFNPNPKCVVRFDGNKGNSTVFLSELKLSHE